MIDFAHLHPVWAGVIWMSEAGIVAVSIGAMIGAVVNSKEGGDAADAARAAGLRPQTPTGSSQSSIDYRKGESA